MKKITNIILAFAVFVTAGFCPLSWNETVAYADDTYTELCRIDFDDVETVEATTDKSAFDTVYEGVAKLLSPRANFNYTVAPKSEGSTDKYIQLDSDYSSPASGYSALHIVLPDGGIKANNGTYRISYDAKLLSASNKPFLRIKTNHTDDPFADTVIANNGGIYNWGPCLGGIAPINDAGTRDQSSANIYGTYSTYEGVENVGWFTASYENENKINLSLNEWHTGEIEIDTVNKKAYYYFDGVYAGCQQGTTFQEKFICGQFTAKNIQLQIEQGWNVGNGFQLDNIVISHSPLTFNGIDRVKTNKVQIVDCADKQLEITSEISAIAKKFEVSVSNVAESSELSSKVVLKKDNEIVPFVSAEYTAKDSRSGILTVSTENYLENGPEYTLLAFDKEYAFKISYPQMLAVASLYVSENDEKVTDITSLTAGDTVSAEVTILNPTNEDKTSVLLAACFDGSKLKSVYFKNISLNKEDTVVFDSLQFDIPEATDLGIKLYVSDTIENFAAMSDCVVLGSDTDTADNTIFEIGETDKNYKNKNITMIVYHPGKTSANLVENTDVSDVIYTVAQEKASEAGEYLFEIGFDETVESGLYKAYTNCGDTPAENRLSYVNVDQNEEAVITLLSSEDFINDAKLYSAALGFGEFVDNVPESAYSILQNYYTDNTVTTDDFDVNLSAVKKCEIIACINTGAIENVFEHSEYLTEETSNISKYFENSYFTENLQKNITSDVKKQNISKIQMLKSDLDKAFVLNLVEDSNGYENLVSVLKSFAGKIGVDSTKITNAVAKKINGKSYSDYPSLKKAIEDASSSNAPIGGGGSGGGGSIGSISKPSGSGDIGGILVTGDQPLDSQVKEISKSIFTDISDSYWGRDAIVYLTERNILNGKSDKLFCPEDYVTREEFTKMIVLAFCDMENVSAVDFSDVDKNAWYYSYIAVANNSGLITGYDAKTFGIGQNITRQDMAVILNRVAKEFNYGFKLPEYIDEFSDNESIADYAVEAVYTLKNAGVIKGNGMGFNPRAFAQRAEAATIIYNMLSL